MSATIDTTERHQVDKVCTLCGRQGDHSAANCPLARACGQRNGIRTLQDIIDRCFLDEDTGCWIWRQAVDKRQGRRGQVPVAYFAAGVVGEKACTMCTARAAWLLSGRALPEGHVVYRAHCAEQRCVNPAHCTDLHRGDMRRECAASNREKGNPHRAAVNRVNAAKQTTPREVVAEVERRLNAGEIQRSVAAAVGVDRSTVQKIAAGRHLFSAGRDLPMVRAASVFTWGLPTETRSRGNPAARRSGLPDHDAPAAADANAI